MIIGHVSVNDCAFIFHLGRDLDKSLSRPRFNNTGEPLCKASGVEIKCRVADGDSLGFELKLVCL